MYPTLQRIFGYSQFRSGQESVISAVLAGRSAAAIFPTGAGKSLCYQLPAVMLPHLTLVVSPLLALIQDQLTFMQRLGIAAASIDSTQSREQTQAVMAEARSGALKILMISVERLNNERFRNFIAQVPISLLVVDEAHCISEWGHNFRPDYLKLPSYQRQLAIPQTLLLTATATPPVVADMQARFAIASADVVCTGFYRSNLDLTVEPVSSQHKQRHVFDWLTQRTGQPTIVYVTLQKTAEQVAEYLSRHGVAAQAYHAGLGHEQRVAIQQQFMAGQVNCVVATIAFGMGIDKSDIRNVVHFDLPKSIEGYSQEIGRAGRDGLPSECLVLANQDSLQVLENFVYGDTPEPAGIRNVLNELLAVPPGQAWELTLTQLSNHSNIRLLPLKTLLVQLELRGIVASRYAYFAEYRFKYLVEPQAVLAHFSGERLQFLQAVLRCAPQARSWCTLDFEALFKSYPTEHSRVVKALNYLAEKGWIALESKQMTEVYAVLQPDFDAPALCRELSDYFQSKETSEVARIQAVLDLFASEHCLSQRLASYFGDKAAPLHCGHCSVCRGEVARWPEPEKLPALAGLSFSALCGELMARHQAHQSAGASAELLTRFLCGITAPLLTRLKARNLSGFAALESYPYAQVRAWVQLGQA
ncbi:MAG: RecQ family ATP-dependent DNA helicase [Rhodoferax sp.]|uniref:RecQ family ATP-dependent DNA helicase n=1 Tax=Rhodoferax sp. TaxID=50421 RepID=UPI00263A0B6E|nr:ATP-dependent DNA helicase RecQ [Rhodoferax sp.]MDD2879996.1 RecQ family ATP-dependent DNA helicase [Rhodoferax sp.]